MAGHEQFPAHAGVHTIHCYRYKTDDLICFLQARFRSHHHLSRANKEQGTITIRQKSEGIFNMADSKTPGHTPEATVGTALTQHDTTPDRIVNIPPHMGVS